MKSAPLAVEAGRHLSGADAPGPGGQEALIHDIAGVERTTPARVPPDRAFDRGPTVTTTKRSARVGVHWLRFAPDPRNHFVACGDLSLVKWGGAAIAAANADQIASRVAISGTDSHT
jgi:hypothetical protein